MNIPPCSSFQFAIGFCGPFILPLARPFDFESICLYGQYGQYGSHHHMLPQLPDCFWKQASVHIQPIQSSSGTLPY